MRNYETPLHIFLQAENGPIKIGKAFNVDKRLKIAQTFNHQDLKIIGSFPGNSTIEKYLHNKFQKQNIRGEWFHPHQELINLANGIFNLEYEEIKGKKYIILWRDFINAETDVCPFCFKNIFTEKVMGIE